MLVNQEYTIISEKMCVMHKLSAICSSKLVNFIRGLVICCGVVDSDGFICKIENETV